MLVLRRLLSVILVAIAVHAVIRTLRGMEGDGETDYGKMTASLAVPFAVAAAGAYLWKEGRKPSPSE